MIRSSLLPYNVPTGHRIVFHGFTDEDTSYYYNYIVLFMQTFATIPLAYEYYRFVS